MDINPSLLALLSGVVAHQYFKRVEPRHPFVWLTLLFGQPTAVAAFSTSQTYGKPSFLSITSLIIIHNAALITSTIAYRISPFHPLARYPGPITARISSLYMTRIAAGGKRHIRITELHSKYGTHVRIGPNAISVVDADGAKDCLESHQRMPKPAYMLWSEISPLNLNSSDCISGPARFEAHTQRRRLWNQAFSGKSLREYDVYIQNRTRSLLNRLGGQSGAVDLGKWISYFSFDMMGDVVFGGGFEMLLEGDKDGIWHLISNAMGTLNIITTIEWIGRIVPYLSTPNEALRMISFAGEQTKIRRSRGSTAKDLFYCLTDDSIKGNLNLSEKQLADEMFLAIITGSDTTSSVMSNAFYSLLSNPSSLAKVREEVDAVFGHDEPTDSARLAGMPYLNAVINETLRLYPALPISLGRTPDKGSGGKLVAGKFVPEGTNIYSPPYALHRDPRYFSPDPETFWPERWLLSSEHQSNVVLNREAFIPFALGPTSCVGKHLAYKEMRAVIASVVQKYDMQFADGYDRKEWLESLKDEYVFVKGRLPVKLTKRT